MSQPSAPDADTTKAESSSPTDAVQASRGKARPSLSSTGQAMSRWIAIAALVLALIAVAIAVAAWFRPAHSGATHFSDQQTADAKKSTCTAYNSAKQAVVINTHMANPRPDDPAGQLAVAVNARLALLGSGQYLRDRLAANPATPGDLTNAVTSMAKTVEDLGMGYLNETSNFVLEPLRSDLNNEIGQLDAICA
jgi:hypothetical protein